jgi:hypothetical protein
MKYFLEYSERDSRICDRIKAVLLFEKGWPGFKFLTHTM